MKAVDNEQFDVGNGFAMSQNHSDNMGSICHEHFPMKSTMIVEPYHLKFYHLSAAAPPDIRAFGYPADGGRMGHPPDVHRMGASDGAPDAIRSHPEPHVMSIRHGYARIASG